MTDPGSAADADMHAFLATEQMEAIRRYLERGRCLKDLADAEVSDTWKRAFVAFVAAHNDPAARQAQDDAEAELELRGIMPPYDDPDIAEARQSLTDVVRRTHAAMSEEDLASMGEKLERDIEAALGRGRRHS